MKIRFLGSGTSTGNPQLLCSCPVCRSTDPKDTRFRASILIESEGKTILVDCGPDFRQQALRANIQQLDAVVLTHEHYDHVGGLDDLRPFCSGKGMPLYAYDRVLKRVQEALPYSFSENPYPGVPLFQLNTVGQGAFWIGSNQFTPIEVIHYRLPVLGFRLKNMAYLTDFNHIETDQLARLHGLDVLIIDALRIRPHLSHNSLQQALDIVDWIQPKQTWLIHMSHDMGLHAEVEARLPSGVFLSWDTLCIEC